MNKIMKAINLVEKNRKMKRMVKTKRSIKTLLIWVLLFDLHFAARAQGYKITATGLEYKILQKGKGAKVEKSHRLFLCYTTKVNEDTAIFDATFPGKPYAFIVGENEGLKGWDEALLLLKVGDSASFKIPASLAYGSRKVGRIAANSVLHFNVKVLNQEEAYYNLQSVIPQKLDSGLIKFQIQKTTGPAVLQFCQLTMNFTGYIKDENGNKRIFQSSLTNSNKAIFQLGAGRMVKGLETGLATMRVGEKATFEIAPYLGFGEEKNGIIPANSTLYFDIEVLNCKDPFFHNSRTDTIYGFNDLKLVKQDENTGELIKADEIVKLHCATYYLDSNANKILLSNTKDGDMPLSLRAGAKIKMMGLNLGLTYLKKGESATIIVPANSENSSLPENSEVKRFYHDVTILEVSPYPFFEVLGKDTIVNAKGSKCLVVRVGTGEVARTADAVTVAYTGYVIGLDGRKVIFDASRENGQLLNFTIGKSEVIPGFEEGITGMAASEARTIIIPAPLGYGEKGVPSAGIPPNATLYFDVELIQIKHITE